MVFGSIQPTQSDQVLWDSSGVMFIALVNGRDFPFIVKSTS